MARKKSNLIELLKKAKVEEGEKPYSESEIYQAISELPVKDVEKLVKAYGETYQDVLEIDDGALKVSIASGIVPKIKRILDKNRHLELDRDGSKKNIGVSEIATKQAKVEAFKEEITRAQVLEQEGIAASIDVLMSLNDEPSKRDYIDTTAKPIEYTTKVDPMDAIRNIIATQSLSEVEKILTVDEAIILILCLGTSNLGQYDITEIADMFGIYDEDVHETLMSAKNKYMAKIGELTTQKKSGFQKRIESPKGK